MRGSFSLLRNGNGIVGSKVIGEAAKLVSCSAFSTSSGPGGGGGGGRGRGRGTFGPTKFDFVAHPGEVVSNEGVNDSDSGMGRGHGRGTPLASTPPVPSFVAPNQPGLGLGRGRGGVVTREFGVRNEGESRPKAPSQQHPDLGLSQGRGGGGVTQESGVGNEGESRPKGPTFLRKDEAAGSTIVAESLDSAQCQTIGEKRLPQSILTALTGTGRGKPEIKPVTGERPKEENRHLRPRREQGSDLRTESGKDRVESKEIPYDRNKPKLSRAEAVKRASAILSSKDDVGQEGGSWNKRDRGKGMGRGRGRGQYSNREDEDEDEDEDDDGALFMGDDADGEKFAQKLGPAVMAELTEAFEDMSSEVLPDLLQDEYIESLDTNLQIELEPEYLFGDFETNPDINENPPIPLRDALEKMKPFLMAYEGIESQEEWEEVMKETMDRVPLLKEIVDHYCGPDTVTAKQQHGELVRVAKTLPESAPNSVTRFTDRAVLSLQSNPGWGFHRKWQLMDKLVNEFSQSYK